MLLLAPMASSLSETSDGRRRQGVRKALAEIRVRAIASGRHFGIAKDEGSEFFKLVSRGRAEVAAAIMCEDQGPEHDFVWAASKQGLMRQSCDQCNGAGVFVAIMKRLGERPRIGNANQWNVSEITARWLRPCVERASPELRRAATERRRARPQRLATKSRKRWNNLTAPDQRPENRNVRASERRSSATTIRGDSKSPHILLQPCKGRCSARYGAGHRRGASGRRRQSRHRRAKRERPAFGTLCLRCRKGRPRAARPNSSTVVRCRESAKHYEFPRGNAHGGKHV